MVKRLISSYSKSPLWFCLVATVVCLLQTPAAPALLLPLGLRCESAGNPIGVDVTKPRLSWKLMRAGRHQAQSLYQILIASSASLLAQAQGDYCETTPQITVKASAN